MPVNTSFKNADKKANDLFKKGFAEERKVTHTAKTATGVTFTTEANKTGDKYALKFGAKYADAKSGFSVDKFEIDSNAKGKTQPCLNAEFSLDEPSLPKCKFNLNLGIRSSLDWKDEKAEFGVQYQVNDKVTTKLLVDPVNKTGSFDVVAAHCKYLAGLQVSSGNLAEIQKNVDFSAFVGTSTKDLSIIARFSKQGEKKTDNCALSVFHQYSSSLSLGTIANIDISAARGNSEQYGKAVSLKAAAKYNIDCCSDLALALGGDAKLKVGYSQKLYPSVKVTGTATVDLKSSAGKIDDVPSFGLQLDFGDL